MALEGKEITALTNSELKVVQDALKITDINDFLKAHGLKDYNNVGVKDFYNSTDFNTYTQTGSYKVDTSLSAYTHAPEGAVGYGILFVFRAVNVIAQLYLTRDVPHKYYYRAFSTNSGTDEQYTWNTVADTSNLKGETLNVTGKATVGSLEVDGDITQKGSSYITHAEQLNTKKDYITMREGATTALADGEYSGVEIVKYDGENNGRLVIDKEGTARVGDAGDERPLATRAEASVMADGKFIKWNSSTNSIETSSESIAVINDAETTAASAWSGANTQSQIKIYGRKYGTCNTAANVQAKTVTNVSGVTESDVVLGFEINVMFYYGSSYSYDSDLSTTNWGQCPHIKGEAGDASAANASSSIEKHKAPTLSINNSQPYPITVGGEYAGEGFINGREVHTFVLYDRGDTYAWEDMTASNIYCSKTRNYSKKRDGLIEQFGEEIVPTNLIINYQIKFPIKFTSDNVFVNTSKNSTVAQVATSGTGNVNNMRSISGHINRKSAQGFYCITQGSTDWGNGNVIWKAEGY